MKTRSLFALAAVAALALCGAAFAAAPDVTTGHLMLALFQHADVGQLLLAVAPVALPATAIRALKARKAEALKAATELAAITDRDLTDDERKALDGHMASIKSLNAQIETAEALANEAAGLGDVEIAAAATITVTENLANDPQRGFKSFGEFAQQVAASAREGRAVDRRLTIGAAAPGTAGNEGVGADGGFAVPPQYSSDIFKLSLGEGSLIPLTDNTEVTGNSMVFPKTEQTPWGTNGVRAYWQSEAAAANATKPALGTQTLRLHKLMALVPLTDELVADTNALDSLIPALVGDSIRWKTNEAILFGNGNGQPLGIFNSPAAISQAKETGQATLTLDRMNIAKMTARMPFTDTLSKQIWIMNNDAMPYLWTLNSNNQILYLPYGGANGAFQNAPNGTLLGRNVLTSQHAPTFTSANDVMLADMSYYRTITKAGGMQTATSLHLYFDADALAFRVTFRIDGSPKIAAPISPAKGSTQLSPFVGLQAR